MRRTNRRAVMLFCVTAVATAASGCASSTSVDSSTDVVIVASTNVWGDIAATIGGAGVDVVSFISSPGQDPHSFEPSARDVLAVSKADVVIENGGGYDDFMTRLLDAGNADPTVLDAVDLSPRSAGAGDAGGTVNEHVWYDLPTVEKVSARMADAFGRADPAHANRYLANARAFAASLDALGRREAAMRNRLDGVHVAVTEPVPHYLLQAVGAVDVTPEAFTAAVEQGDEVSVSVLDETLRLFTDHRVAALVYNEQASDILSDRMLTAAEDSDVPVVPVSETLPTGVSYVSWMTDNLDRLDAALSAQ